MSNKKKVLINSFLTLYLIAVCFVNVTKAQEQH